MCLLCAVCSIDLEQKDDEYDGIACALAERALALAFRAAAEGPHGLRLQAYYHHAATGSVSHILAQLPAQHLQHLQISFEDEQPLTAALVPVFTMQVAVYRLIYCLCLAQLISSVHVNSSTHGMTLYMGCGQ
jgi:hypothetical protein